MAIGFPSSPSNGATYTFNGITYVYNAADKRWTGQFTAADFSSLGTAALNISNTDSDTDNAPLVSNGAGGFKFGDASGGGGGGGSRVEFFSTSSGLADIFTNIDVSAYNRAQFFGYVRVGKSGGSGVGTFAASISFDGGTTILNLISTSQTTNHSVDTTTGTSVDISAINTLTFQAGTRVVSGSGSGRSGDVRGTLILTNTLG